MTKMRGFVSMCMLIASLSSSALANAQEPFRPATFIEADGADKVVLRCIGVGADHTLALQNARLSCIEWYATTYLLLTVEQEKAYQRLRMSVFSQVDKLVSRPTKEHHPKGLGIKAEYKTPQGKTTIEILGTLEKTLLKKELVRLGIREEKAVPMSVVLVLSDATRSLAGSRVFLSTTESVLLKEQWEILPASSTQAAASPELSSEAMAKTTAEKAGARLALLIEAKEDQKKNGSISFLVTLSAIEAASGKKVATVVSQSAPRASFIAGESDAAKMEASLDAANQLLPALERYRAKAGQPK